MSTHPIDIIANAVHAAECGCGTAGAVSRNQAQTAASALTQDAVIIHAARALAADTASRPNSPLASANMTIAAYEHIARVVLHSVGGG